MYALKDNYRETVFNVGIYARLSKEDEQNIEVSESITNQIDYLTQYVLEQGWNLVDVFADDGYTGTNFNRPDFNRMLQAIEEGRINAVITKDLSRLGRDYVGTGQYMEYYFPLRNVRYIAVNDGIDTYEKNSTSNEMSAFRSVFNDYYARDISKKVRTSMGVKARKGQFIGSHAPYGYLKSPEDKNKLIVDRNVAPIVLQMFESYLAGDGITRIAHTLNDQEIPSPVVYKTQIYPNYKNAKSKFGKWTAEGVKSILQNPVYAGCLAQHKQEVISYKVKKLKAIPKEKWIIVEGCHEAIVSKDMFDQVQDLMKVRNVPYPNSSKKEHLLVGLLFCKDCGHRMTFTKTQKGEWYCICANYKRFKSCTRHSYLESDLDNYVLDHLRKTIAAFVDREELLKKAREAVSKKPKVDRTEQELKDAEKRIEEIKRAIKSLYEDKLKGILSEQDFIDLSQGYTKERDALTAKVERLKEKELAGQQQEDADQKLLRLAQGLLELTSIPKTVLPQLIERIEVSEDKKIFIHYKFREPVFHG